MHTGRPLGERFAELPGRFFFIWIVLTVGATGLVASVLSVQAIWRLRQQDPVSSPGGDLTIGTNVGDDQIRPRTHVASGREIPRASKPRVLANA